MKQLITIVLCLLGLYQIEAQIIIVDGISGNPLEGVAAGYITSTGQPDYLFSDKEGLIEIRMSSSIYLTHLGYLPQEIIYRQGERKEVKLTPTSYEIDEVVVTGQNQQMIARDAVQNVTVIGREEMKAVGARTVSEALSLNPRVQIIHDPALGNQITIAGMRGKHIKIMIDGVPVIGRLDGNIDLDQLSLTDVVRIEVIEGPMSVEYGTDAIGGTINIITSRNETQRVVRVGGSYETTDRSDVQVMTRSELGPIIAKLNARRAFFGGSKLNDDDRGYFWQPKEHYNVNLDLTKQIGQIQYSLGVGYFQETLWNDGDVQYQTVQQQINDSIVQILQRPFALDTDFKTRRIDGRFGAKGKLKPRVSFRGFVAPNYYERERLTRRVDLTSLSEVITPNTADHDTSVFVSYSSRSSVTFDRRYDITIGYDASYDIAEGKRFQGSEEDYLNLAGFASLVYENERLQVRPGIRYQYNSVFDAPLIPSVHVRYKMKQWILRASYAKGFRAPDMKELYFYFVDSNHNIQGNTDLQAESSDAVQASITKRNSFDKAILDTRVRGYFNDVSNMISLALVDINDLLYSYVNISRQQVVGIEFGQDLVANRWKLGYNLNYFEQESAFSREDDERERNTIQLSGSVNHTFPKHDIQFNTQLNYFGREQQFFTNDGQITELIRDPYTMLTVSISKRFMNKVDLRLGVRNLLDVQNINSATQGSAHTGGSNSTPVSLGRAFFVNLSWDIL
ncbi:MAG: TonB-dependent receptor [Flavobacteriales bacterium]|nr:TonB-dependent receptor [Flavobacteriales bacterium]